MRALSRLLLVSLLVLAPTAAFAEEAPIRAQHRLMAGVELGWNTLSGIGLNGSFHLLPRLSLDAGFGMSLVGPKVGLRARVNLLTTAWTPFLGAGLLYGFGTGSRESSIPVGGETVTYRVQSSPFAQLVAGVDYTDDGGFTLLVTAGYALLLRENVSVTSGQDNSFAKQSFDTLFHSGISGGVTLGYSF